MYVPTATLIVMMILNLKMQIVTNSLPDQSEWRLQLTVLCYYGTWTKEFFVSSFNIKISIQNNHKLTQGAY